MSRACFTYQNGKNKTISITIIIIIVVISSYQTFYNVITFIPGMLMDGMYAPASVQYNLSQHILLSNKLSCSDQAVSYIPK